MANTKSATGHIESTTPAAQKKRILLVVRWPVGGIRTFMRYVYRHFDPAQYHFSIIGPNNPELDVLANDLEGLDVTIYKMSVNPKPSEIFSEVFKLLLRGRYDLVHSHGFTSGICSTLPAIVLKTPHLLTSHDVLSSAQFCGNSGKFKKIVMRFVLEFVNTVHSVSYDAQANLLEFFPSIISGGKCIVIPNGIESERFVHANPRDFREELNVGNDTFLIGFLGRFMSQKGFVYLVDAIEGLKKAGNLKKKPLVLTFADGAFIREEKAAISERGLNEFFNFMSFTPNVAGVIKGLDLVVMPSLWEACGLLAMETLAAGTPIIASDCIGLREVVRDTPAYVVPAKDSAALEEGIRFFMEKDMKQTFHDFAPIAAKRYDVASTAASLQNLVDAIINGTK